jgi:hypothetical protein
VSEERLSALAVLSAKKTRSSRQVISVKRWLRHLFFARRGECTPATNRLQVWVFSCCKFTLYLFIYIVMCCKTIPNFSSMHSTTTVQTHEPPLNTTEFLLHWHELKSFLGPVLWTQKGNAIIPADLCRIVSKML